MNNQVQFDEPGMEFRKKGPQGPRRSWLMKMVLSSGLAKDEKQASVVLLAIGVLALVLMFIFWPRSNYVIVPQNIDAGSEQQ